MQYNDNKAILLYSNYIFQEAMKNYNYQNGISLSRFNISRVSGNGKER